MQCLTNLPKDRQRETKTMRELREGKGREGLWAFEAEGRLVDFHLVVKPALGQEQECAVLRIEEGCDDIKVSSMLDFYTMVFVGPARITVDLID